jgi:hypothetical protein
MYYALCNPAQKHHVHAIPDMSSLIIITKAALASSSSSILSALCPREPWFYELLRLQLQPVSVSAFSTSLHLVPGGFSVISEPAPLSLVTVSLNASARTVARIAGAPADHDYPAGESSAQNIELLEYPSGRAGSLDREAPESGPAPQAGPGYRTGVSYREDGGAYVSQRRPGFFKYWVEALRRRSLHPQPREADPKMKFSHSLQFNAVPDWSAYYIAYSSLKKL